MTTFGPIVTGADVRDAAMDTLKLWMPSYLGEVSVNASKGRCDLPKYRSWRSSVEVEHWPEDQLPGCIVVSPGLLPSPEKHGSRYNAEWAIAVASIVSGNDWDSTMDLVNYYTAAARSALLQHPSLGGYALGIRWIDESYNELGVEDSRTIASGVVSFGVEIANVVDVSLGVQTVPVDPCLEPGNFGTVQSTPLSTEGAA